MATSNSVYIGGELYVQGSQLTPRQMEWLSVDLELSPNSYPDYVKTQFFAQGGSFDTPVDAPATVNPTVDPASTRTNANTNNGGLRSRATRLPPTVNPKVDPEAASASNREFVNNEGGAATGIRRKEVTRETIDAKKHYVEEVQPESPLAGQIQSGIENAQNQPAQEVLLGNEASNGDWRVRLSLGQNADYLYNDRTNPGILQPLVATNGVIFPYTPKIDTSYKTNYSPYDVTHSNFRGYYYQNSQVGDITITAHFTAQNTFEANYLLAVIHFFRSAGKMFYGQDAQRGTPPPLLFLTGLGQYQFNKHPVLLSSFSYALPEDVDYIRAHVTNQVGTNLTQQNNVKKSVPTSSNAASGDRLSNAGLDKGALPNTPFGSAPSTPELASGAPTYVPTKMDITITLLPVNTRQQISKQFSLKQFANGNLLRGGFW
jgi:hypothetical protein